MDLKLKVILGVVYDRIEHESSIHIPEKKLPGMVEFLLGEDLLPPSLREDAEIFLAEQQDKPENRQRRMVRAIAKLLEIVKKISPAERLALFLEELLDLDANTVAALLRSGKTARELYAMTVEELDAIPGIGPKRAIFIMSEWEWFRSNEDVFDAILAIVWDEETSSP